MSESKPDIRMLDAATANRIAAGEVVERPASIVKELAENSIDAGATAITIEIRNAGIDYIRIADNGSGIAPGQVRMAFERHATSKLRSGASILEVASMGFRGEALPSIAAVTKLEMQTRTIDELSGIRIVVEGGHIADIREAGVPEGTTIIVRELFYNTPARRKFLKTPQTESAAVSDAVTRLALSHPGVSIKYIVNGKQVYQTPGDGDIRTILSLIYNVEFARGLIPIKRVGAIGISGLLGVGEAARATRTGEMFFINKRPINSRPLSQGVEAGCEGRVMVGRYPFCALYMDTPMGMVDFNVHPNKLEVRFSDEFAIREAVTEAVASALRDGDTAFVRRHFSAGHARVREAAPPNVPPIVTPTVTTLLGSTAPQKTQGGTVSGVLSTPPPTSGDQVEGMYTSSEFRSALPHIVPPQPRFHAIKPQGPMPVELLMNGLDDGLPRHAGLKETFSRAIASQPPVQEAMDATRDEAPQYRFIGHVFDLYALIVTDSTLFIIDQHAAHERLVYERLMADGLKAASQAMLSPLVVELSPREIELLMSNMTALNDLGFELERFGISSVRLTALPMILGEAQGKPFILDVIKVLERGRQASSREMVKERLIEMACKRAVKAGDALTEAEMRGILDIALKEGVPLTCPHGRPILMTMEKSAIDRWFKR